MPEVDSGDSCPGMEVLDTPELDMNRARLCVRCAGGEWELSENENCWKEMLSNLGERAEV